MKLAIFSIYAQRDFDYFGKIADELSRNHQIKCGFISFYQAANKQISSGGYHLIDPYQMTLGAAELQPSYRGLDLDTVTRHEQKYTGVELRRLEEKFFRLLFNLEVRLNEIASDHTPSSVTIFSELGGFVAFHAVFHASRRLGFTHYFIEPSIFDGRCHFSRDTFSAPNEESGTNFPSDEEDGFRADYSNLLAKYASDEAIAAPVKDAHHFKKFGFLRVLSISNWEKFSKKILNLYLKRHRSEFDFPIRYAWWNIRRIYNSYLNKRHQKSCNLLEMKPYIYYPLHVTNDVSLTVRAPDRWDQFNTIREILESTPSHLRLIVKEHPASVGEVNIGQWLGRLSADHRARITFAEPYLSSIKIIKESNAVITVNSKVGAEAILQNKLVLCLGDSFYNRFPGVLFSKKARLPENITHPLKDTSEARECFRRIWDSTLLCGLYDMNHVHTAAKSFGKILQD